MKIELSQSQLVDLFIERMKSEGFCVSHTNGPYNKADPTHREEVTAKVFIAHGYSFSVESDLNPDAPPYPDPEVVVVNVHDVTWGVVFSFDTSLGVESAYYARSTEVGKDGKWHRATENFGKVFKDIFLTGESPNGYEIDEETSQYEPAWR